LLLYSSVSPPIKLGYNNGYSKEVLGGWNNLALLINILEQGLLHKNYSLMLAITTNMYKSAKYVGVRGFPLALRLV
jgi:hypothetical protein